MDEIDASAIWKQRGGCGGDGQGGDGPCLQREIDEARAVLEAARLPSRQHDGRRCGRAVSAVMAIAHQPSVVRRCRGGIGQRGMGQCASTRRCWDRLACAMDMRHWLENNEMSSQPLSRPTVAGRRAACDPLRTAGKGQP
jgi:hypothetical protein